MKNKSPMDEIDKKILSNLERNARISAAKISKITGIGQDTIRSRIIKLERNGIIKTFQTVLSPQILGFPVVAYITITLAEDDATQKKALTAHFTTHPYVYFASTETGNWDFLITVCAKDFNHLDSIICDLYKYSKAHIKETTVSLLIQEFKAGNTADLFNLEKFNKKTHTTIDELHFIRYGKEVKLDEKDYAILNAFNLNARISLSEASNKTKIQRDCLRYRLKRMEKLGVIRYYHTFIDPLIMGFDIYAHILFSVYNHSKERENEFISYIKKDPHFIYISRVSGRWDMIMSVVANDQDHFDSMIENLKKEFSDLIKEFDTTKITREFKCEEMVGLINHE